MFNQRSKIFENFATKEAFVENAEKQQDDAISRGEVEIGVFLLGSIVDLD